MYVGADVIRPTGGGRHLLPSFAKALNELRFNNVEFEHVKQKLDETLILLRVDKPEVGYFVDTFIDSCTATVDQLAGIDKLNLE